MTRDWPWDVFLSYASDDRAAIAIPLRDRLRQRGLRVWFDLDQGSPGAGIATTLDEALAGSRHAVALLSRAYFNKMWTTREKDAVFALERDGHQRLIPVLCGVGLEELTKRAPLIAGRICLSLDDGLDPLAAAIAAQVHLPRYRVLIASTLLADHGARQRLQEAVESSGMTAVGSDLFAADRRASAAEVEQQARSAELVVVVAAFRYGHIPAGQERSALEIAHDAATARLVLLPEDGTKVDPEQDYDLSQDGPDLDLQKRLMAFKKRVAAAALRYSPATETSTLRSALLEWRKTRDPKPVTGDALSLPPGFGADLADYQRRAHSLYGSLRLPGFDSAVRVPLRLEDLFVPLHANVVRGSTGAVLCADEAERAYGTRTEEVPLTEAFWKGDRTLSRRGLVILGDPGSGKTTHLKRVLLWVIDKGAESLGLSPGTVPLLLPLRDLQPDDDLRAFVTRTLTREELHLADEVVGALLKRGRVLLLLDGLDEIVDEDARAKAAQRIDKWLGANPDARLIVTCRYAAYSGDARLPGDFLEMHLRPLNRAQAEEFVRRWYQNVEKETTPDPAQATALATAQADALLLRLREADVIGAARVFELTRNPLLLTAICLVHRDKGELPKHRATLYESCVNVLLEHWRKRQGVAVRFAARAAREVLKPLALWLHGQEKRTRASLAELTPVLAPLLQAARIDEAPERFLKTIRDQSGLLTGYSGDTFGFMHLGFQEYLTALALFDRAVIDPTEYATLAARFGESWWREVIVLMLSSPHHGGAFTPLFREVVKLDAFAAHADLVRECLADATAPKPDAFVELLRVPMPRETAAPLQARVEAAAEALRGLAPDVLANIPGYARRDPRTAAPATQRSRRGEVELVTIPRGNLPATGVSVEAFLLGKYAVTNEEYGRFLAAYPGRDEPSYWSDKRFNQPRQPVVGVSWQDAVDFCQWAGGRLPTEAEWEYASRAGSTTEYCFGDDEEMLLEYAWFFRNSGKQVLPADTEWDLEKVEGEWGCVTHPVGEKRPNAWGLYDMHGNVWEWCANRYDGKPEPDGAPHGGADRVIRGGSFGDEARWLRSAYRFGWSPVVRSGNLGFRLAVSPAPSR